MSPEAAAEQGLYHRLVEDTALAALLGTGVRVFPTWPGDTMSAGDFPRLSFYCFGPPPRRPGFQRVRVTLDEWVWETGTNGGRAKLLAVDERITALLDEQHWQYGGYRLYSLAGGWRDGSGGGRMRRSRDITIEASPLS